MPKFVNFFEKERRVQACEAMFSDYQGVYKQINTGDESCIYAYDPETTDQSSEYRLKGEVKPKRLRQSRSKIKVMLTVFFDYCALRIPSNWPNCQQGILLKCYTSLA